MYLKSRKTSRCIRNIVKTATKYLEDSKSVGILKSVLIQVAFEFF